LYKHKKNCTENTEQKQEYIHAENMEGNLIIFVLRKPLNIHPLRFSAQCFDSSNKPK